MRILITGDRQYKRVDVIDSELRLLHEEWGHHLLVIHGAANGADNIAHNVCKARGIPMHVFPARWKELGRSAGPARNAEMLADLLEGETCAVVAFHDDFKNSKGTKDMCKRAIKAGVTTTLVEWGGTMDRFFSRDLTLEDCK